MIGAPLAEDSSDSQDLNRVVETLIHRYGFSLFEAIEMVFPPILHELKQLPDELKDLYTYYRQMWGPFAQGPAAIVSRYGDECAFSVDALDSDPCGWWRASAPSSSPPSRESSPSIAW